jgi:hypothetical protein
VIDLLENAANGNGDPASLKEKIAALNLDADPAAVQDLRLQFPQKQIERLRNPIQVGMRRVREDTLKSLTEFEVHGRYSGPDAFRSWLDSTKQQYKAWLSRL